MRADIKERLVYAITAISKAYGGTYDSMRWAIIHANIGYETLGTWSSEARLQYFQMAMNGDW